VTERTVALSARGIVKRYGSLAALDDVSLMVAAGECVALVGESGSGKSTLLRCFNRMVEPDAGTILIGDSPAATLDPIALRRRTGYVPQDGGLLPHWRVRRNVELVPWLKGLADAASRGMDALSLVGLDPSTFAERWPHELSGGQRQRVAIARALAGDPVVILLDEPFGALDAITRADMQSAFRDLRARLGLTTLLVTHDLHEAELLADRIAVLRHGRIEAIAPMADLLGASSTTYVQELFRRARMGPS